MNQCIFDSQSLRGVQNKTLLYEFQNRSVFFVYGQIGEQLKSLHWHYNFSRVYVNASLQLVGNREQSVTVNVVLSASAFLEYFEVVCLVDRERLGEILLHRPVREEHFSGEQFVENAAERPYVGREVKVASETHFWRAIRLCLQKVVRLVIEERSAAEIDDFDLCVRRVRVKQVFGFEVAVNEIERFEQCETTKDVPCDRLQLFCVQLSPRLDDCVIEVDIEFLGYDVQLLLISRR